MGFGLVMAESGLAVLAAFLGHSWQCGAKHEFLDVGMVSPFRWDTALKHVDNPGIFDDLPTDPQRLSKPPPVVAPPRAAKSARKPVKAAPKAKKAKASKAAAAAGPAGGGAVTSEQLASLRSQVGETIAAVIGEEPSADSPLMEAGLDSLGSVELRNSLVRLIGTAPGIPSMTRTPSTRQRSSALEGIWLRCRLPGNICATSRQLAMTN